ncbi:MAG: leucyl aminopeptidase [Deltaproteobacteria bacterium HGW-Deltaproteobacteria-18]|jgi:leucyl aminopeptidase|nr:MAG: leucyl aminopeptidase [Deltaproteobacteria bacterium HGW-Deltaproteobacteria-18]
MNIDVFLDGGELKDAVLLMFRSEGADWSEADLELARPFGLDPSISFSGKAGRTRLCSTPGGSCLLVGLGKASDLDLDGFRAAVGTAVRVAASQELSSLAVASEHLDRLELIDDLTLECVVATRLAGYRFVAFKSDPGDEDCPASLAVLSQDTDMQEKVARALAVAEGVILARDLVNTPANVATPEHLAGVARDLGARFGFGVQVFGPEEIVGMGMGSFASVFRGSDTPARFIVLDSAPGSDAHPLVFVGKGVTFDTGGISLKPSAKMHEMKGDMAGAAAILGLFRALGQAGGSVRRVVGLLPCTENVPGSKATKPGDVVTAMNGKTIEILNTDAEGRLILADALAYSARFKPEILVDLATLTGACLVALGTKVAAVFATTAELDQRIREGGSRVGERFWPMPLWKEYGEPLKGDVADLKNIATREGGAIYAAMFLKNFVPEGVDWAHLDIAGPAWTDENASIFRPGGTGFGVRTLWELVGAYDGREGEMAL